MRKLWPLDVHSTERSSPQRSKQKLINEPNSEKNYVNLSYVDLKRTSTCFIVTTAFRIFLENLKEFLHRKRMNLAVSSNLGTEMEGKLI